MKLTVPESVTPSVDLIEIGRALAALIPPEKTFELRSLPAGRSWVGRDIQSALDHVPSLATGTGLYYMLNPVRPDLKGAAKNADIIERARLLIDIDSVRPDPDLPATDAEKTQAGSVAMLVMLDLKSRGCPEPIVIDSGNGYQLIYRVDLPNDDLSHKWISCFLKRLADTYDTPGAKVDTSVHNAGRLARLPGTWNRKGPHSDDRPHRMAHVERIPETLDPIPVDVFRALTGLATVEPSTSPRLASWTVPAVVTGEVAAWFRKAFEGEAGKVAMAPEGNRHNALRAAARTLAGYVHHGQITESEIVARLTEIGRRNGLDEKDVREAIAWGIENGKSNPMPWPDKLAAKKNQNVAAVDTEGKPKPPIVWASDIEPKKVKFLWPGRIPLGKMTTFAGQGGLGKTFVLCDIAARVSNGDEWPFSGGECADRGKVLFISGEDDEDDTLVPRLIECGADLSRIAFLSAPCHDDFTLAALEMLTSVIGYMTDVRLVVIDPPTSYLGGVDDHKNAELRSVLTPLKRWAAENEAAVILNTHINKATGQNIDAASRVMGSVAWVNAVRAAHMFVRDQDEPDKVSFVPIKINISKRPVGLSYRIVTTRDDLARVEWLGTIDQTADEAMNKEARKPKAKNAREWLIDMFRRRQEWPSDLFWKELKAGGCTEHSLNSVREALMIPKSRRIAQPNGDVQWVWWVPADWPFMTEN